MVGAVSVVVVDVDYVTAQNVTPDEHYHGDAADDEVNDKTPSRQKIGDQGQPPERQDNPRNKSEKHRSPLLF
ncbi:hypothetical protein A3E96_01430 [Candidatus Uhrbacteria bacterium RIFCSPHIGHO2_12_FULL_46_13]|uniref:Uncharacterized protein n=1 Tax=Candidatus Uhrbacteria bacterium RIFCSPLOWO2_01_FULL_47_25 TaxID=1802402 RepID=A0A1F7UPM5_9BACT|nr:MAG: hypothetical protein A2752_00575 [Candidatus Uhrbacteria bacterium RIFCSPHIGHO2_01_FULL_46_23]OGL69187.1 MAG: hypothetical protein A3D60_04780 [Candidatus Uhrbacteria bacterium RIFCSPHIGHO2_02_FULL_47_29]OGL75310.1 MAG: hypothetical protein A3E96_01430 [Candidatus Uhrbacteria bacterium RIFCSPHIGHO2_12_FULL_46_13]OGL80250.1 MAG: hypothetical protein A2936_02685 [Candidatus Uhrbacteria bacterium RIFCSPLOWO2_01_FULL_47_25]